MSLIYRNDCLKNPEQVEAEEDIPFGLIASCLSQKAGFVNPLRIGEVHLENVSAGFQIHTDGERVVEG